MLKIEQLKETYQELINILELVNDDQEDIKIPEDISKEELIDKIQEAGSFLREGLENKEKLSVSPEMLLIFADEDITNDDLKKVITLVHQKTKPVEKVKEAKVPSPSKVIKQDEDLADVIESAKTTSVLIKLAKENILFKDIVNDLKRYKTLDDLKDIMLDTLDEIAKKGIEESVGNKKPELIKEGIQLESLISVNDIISKEPYNNLFPINPNVLNSITNNMESVGYDPAFPVILWGNTLIDGNTRLQAAIAAGIRRIPMLRKEFDSEKDALEYAIHNQRNRRNVTEAEILHCIELLDKPMSKKEAGKLKGSKDGGKSNFEIKIASEPSHKKTAKVLGVGESKVSDARTVLKDEKAKKEVESGKKTISKAAKEIREKKSVEKPKKAAKIELEIIPTIIKTLREFEGKEVEIEEIITTTFEILMDVNGTKATNAKIVETEVYHTVDVLIAFGWIKKNNALNRNEMLITVG